MSCHQTIKQEILALFLKFSQLSIIMIIIESPNLFVETKFNSINNHYYYDETRLLPYPNLLH